MIKIKFPPKSSLSFENPPGFDFKSKPTRKPEKQGSIANLKAKKAWDAALAPGKSIFMTLFMLWMSGSSVQIFSLMITGMSLYNPIKALCQLNNIFSAFESKGESFFMQKVTFAFFQLLTLLIGLYKCSNLGLLPTSTSDWLSFYDEKFNKTNEIVGYVI
ncbi:Protein of unknown function DUF1077, TMEM85 domain-containing protein [Rozella allomycis CSF55]|uniref:ER membrane protein complex subunit 4 n=1 Tax=Rozella allomycis (strain CSF55) TaxID=988480 RepID=A0A075AYR1_ROZAC|nr:Protein of unknown function DUF1077, TMEM85 domain-containing protein [Rozella allomycis CSF55]|eukprot:EPZ33669.1 Protein of unknown function DUF1077, TMEM85 domain-containing protein [Rozella allomycis CSF55]